MKYKLLVSDIDGVWTDGSFYYSDQGDAMRKFTTKDSFGVSLCQLQEIPILIISTEENEMVRKRMEKLHIKHVRLGIRNKLKTITEFCRQENIELTEVAYIGDDMNDYHLLEKLGLFACPADGYQLIKDKAEHILQAKGGEGAFREFVEYLFKKEGILDAAYRNYKALCLEK